MSTTTKTVTAAELFRMPDDGFRYELVDGELIQMTPSGGEHGAVVINLSSPLHQHVKANKLGVVCGAETGYKLRSNPDTVLAPDISFVSAERIPASGVPRAFWTQPPDLAVEVASPSDTLRGLDKKANRWLAEGAALVWVVISRKRTVIVYRPSASPITLTEADVLDGGSVVPGFTCPVASIFG